MACGTKKKKKARSGGCVSSKKKMRQGGGISIKTKDIGKSKGKTGK